MFSSIGHLPEPRGEVTTSQPPTATSDGERTTYTLTLGTLQLKVSHPSRSLSFSQNNSVGLREGGGDILGYNKVFLSRISILTHSSLCGQWHILAV